MTVNPFRVEGPAIICFSGGRTSAFMLRRILDAHDGVLPPDVFVTFANTGDEREETYDFVFEVGDRWRVPIKWLEYRREPFNPNYYPADPVTGERPERSTLGRPVAVEVDYRTASRKAEPFFNMIRWMADYRAMVKGLGPILPNPAMRICTDELKIKTQRRWMEAQGFTTYESCVGIRADEPRRVARARARDDDETYPLVTEGVTKEDVLSYWKTSPFDLALDPNSDEGNCKLCFMKAREKVVRIMRRTKEHDFLMIEAERLTGQTWRKDRSYTDLRARIDAGLPIKGVDEDAVGDCFCGDGS